MALWDVNPALVLEAVLMAMTPSKKDREFPGDVGGKFNGELPFLYLQIPLMLSNNSVVNISMEILLLCVV